MNRLLTILLASLAATAPAQTVSTNDFVLSQKTAGLYVLRPVAPTNHGLFALNASGVLEMKATSTLGRTLINVANEATARAALELTIGTHVQQWDADLDAIKALAGTNTIYYRSAADTWTGVTIGSTLGFTGGTLSLTVPVLVASGGTGTTTGSITGTGALTFTAGGTNENIILAPTGAGVTTTAKPVTLTGTTASSSSTTGELIVAGGVGIAKDSWINGVRVGVGPGGHSSNTVVGAGAGASLAAGEQQSTVFGVDALASSTNTDSNTVFGYKALTAKTNGTGDTAFGERAGLSLITGGDSTFLGREAGNNYSGGVMTVASSVTLVGAGTGTLNNGESLSYAIGAGAQTHGSQTGTLGSPGVHAVYIYGAPSGGGNLGVRLASNFTTTSSSNTDTALAFAVLANEVWIVDIAFTALTPAAGMSLQISAPSGSTVEGSAETSTLSGSVSSTVGRRFTAINTLSGIVSAVSVTCRGYVRVTVTVGANAGTVALGAASVTNTQLTTIYAGSVLKAQRVQ